MYKKGILQQTTWYKNGKVSHTQSTPLHFTPTRIGMMLNFFLLILTIYVIYRLWKTSRGIESKWIFEGHEKQRWAVIDTIIRLFLTASFVGIVSVLSSILYDFSTHLIYKAFGFKYFLGMEVLYYPF